MEPISTQDIRKVMRTLPHRYPFLLVDRVIEFQPGVLIRALKNVTINEPFFQGHFPGAPVMPGVLIIEALAQAGGILAFTSIGEEEAKTKLAFFMGIDKARFRKPVIPGDQLILEGRILRLKARICQIEAKAFVGNDLVAEAILMSSLVDREA